jgi:predicted signal transduction protein with EAL and GGDEF domain
MRTPEPVDILKIDKLFVDAAAADDPGAMSLIRAIVDLGVTLELTTVAEGVEDGTILAELVDIGCDSVQGFHFARPMPATEITALLQHTPPLTPQLPAAQRPVTTHSTSATTPKDHDGAPPVGVTSPLRGIPGR